MTYKDGDYFEVIKPGGYVFKVGDVVRLVGDVARLDGKPEGHARFAGPYEDEAFGIRQWVRLVNVRPLNLNEVAKRGLL